MTKREARKLAVGLYRLHWKNGRVTLATVGARFDGARWFVIPLVSIANARDAAWMDWPLIDRAEVIELAADQP